MVLIPERDGKKESTAPPTVDVANQEEPKVPNGDLLDSLKAEGEADASPVADGEKPEGDSGRDRKEFFENIVIGESDIGKTLYRKIKEAEKSADSVTKLSKTEEKFLDDLLFKGYVSHKIFIKDGFPVTFRSTSPIVPQRAFDLIAGEKGSRVKMNSIESCMMVAIYLESYGVSGSDLYFSHERLLNHDFGTEESIRLRFDFVSNELSSIVVDLLLTRIREFLSLLNRISASKNIINF